MTTGPGAVAQGFVKFMGAGFPCPKPLVAGIYTGAYGWTVRIVGSRKKMKPSTLKETFIKPWKG
jgi:hypothetical protein